MTSSSVLLYSIHDCTTKPRVIANTAGTFIFVDDDATFLRPIDIGNQVAAQ